jgi:hypothetical protein
MNVNSQLHHGMPPNVTIKWGITNEKLRQKRAKRYIKEVVLARPSIFLPH